MCVSGSVLGLGVYVLGDECNPPWRIAVWSPVTLTVAVTDCNNKIDTGKLMICLFV